MSIIPIHPKVVAQLKSYVEETKRLALVYNESLALIRMQLEVPEDYEINNLDVGFEPPKKEKGQEISQPE